MKSITKQKSLEEIQQQLVGLDRVYIIGCGTCTTMTRTGGRDEVLEMKERLQGMDKIVTGWLVTPTACDEMTGAALVHANGAIANASCVVSMSCAMGVQRMAGYLDKPVLPALDTLFIGLESSPGDFHEICAQCGHCLLGYTAGICPVTACHKHLLNGPCGGTDSGRCEVDKDKDCAWTLIYKRLKQQGRLDVMRRYQPVKNSQVVPRPRIMRVD